MRISDWSSDVCSSDLLDRAAAAGKHQHQPNRYPPWQNVFIRRFHRPSSLSPPNHSRTVSKTQPRNSSGAKPSTKANCLAPEHPESVRAYSSSSTHTHCSPSLETVNGLLGSLWNKADHTRIAPVEPYRPEIGRAHV